MINGEDMRYMRLGQKRQMNGIFCVFVAIAYKKTEPGGSEFFLLISFLFGIF